MNTIARGPDDASRLTLALLLALGLHAVLLFGIPADWWSLRYPKPLRFDVVLLPPAERSRIAKPAPSAATVPETGSGAASVAVAAPNPVAAPAPEPLPVAPPQSAPVEEPAPASQPSPIATAKPTPPPPPQPAPATKPISKPATPAKPPAAANIAPAPRTAPKPAPSPKAAKPPEKAASAPSNKSATKPRETISPPIKSTVPAIAKPAPAVTALEPARPTRRSGQSAGSAPRGRLDSGALLGQIAGLEAETQRRANAGIRSKRVSPNDTQSLEGFYIAAWVRKVEQIGEMNFPEIARKLNLNTGPVLDVAIRADGTLKEVRIVRSSGNAELDQAAQRIVRLGAPYAPFSSELRQRYDVLLISRPWRFEPGGRVRSR
ncbi:MAG TPA: TonB family protein [Candidatus Competibacter sp.]|nr:TonB family protein [Candidatus Competibacter sp.]